MKVLICYFENNPKAADHEFNTLVNRLVENGIDILRVNEVLMVVDTPHTYTHVVYDPNKLRGRRYDELFNNATDALDYILQEEERWS